MRTITITTTVHDVTVIDPRGQLCDLVVELPYTDPHGADDMPIAASQVGTKLVVSYLLHDPDRYDLNPFESCDPWMSAPDSWGIGLSWADMQSRFDLGCKHVGVEGWECDVHHPDRRERMDGDPDWHDYRAPDWTNQRVVFAYVGDGHGPYTDYRLCDGPDDANSFLIFDDEWGESVLADVRTAARNMLDEYCKWANGEVYAIVHAAYQLAFPDEGRVVATLIDCDSCCGYIGAKYAEREMHDEHQFHVVDVAK